MSMDYSTIKQLAKERGVKVTDLIALAPQNDPFYCGQEAQQQAARWFADLWERFGYREGVHIRRIHYQIVSQQPPVTKPNGLPYENTENDWGFLLLSSKAARYLKLVDPEAFVDRRNPEPHVFAEYWRHNGRPEYWLEDWHSFDVQLPAFPDLPDFHISGYDANLQPYHLEVWAEKSTMNDVLLPVCKRYGVNLVTGAGEMSITAALAFLERARRVDRPCRIFYISDFDPAGMGMPISVARKIEYFLRERDLDLGVKLEPIALLQEQCRQYRLPRTPIKETEKRREKFETTFGEGATELDALEALYPGELARLVEAAILTYHDPEIAERANEQRQALADALAQAREESLADLQPELASLRQEFDQAVSTFAQAIEGLRGRMGQTYAEVVRRLEAVDVDASDYPCPEGREVYEPNGKLFDSARDYETQLTYYQARRGGKVVEE
jgi:hypothetical protein